MPWISFPFYSHGLHSLWQKEPQYFCTVTFLPSLSSLWCLCSPCYTQIPILNGICYVPKRSNTIRCPHQLSPLMGVSNSWDDTLDIICKFFRGLLCVSTVLWSFSFTQVLWSVSSSISSALPFFLLVSFTGKLAVLTAVQQVQLGEGQCSSNSVCFLYIKLVILSEQLGLFDLLMQ